MSCEILDLLIIGGGPTGLSAANEATRNGLKHVVVLERESEAGGAPRHCGHRGFGIRDFRRLYTGPEYARRLRTLRGGFELRCSHAVTEIAAGGKLKVSAPQGTYSINARRVLIATGTYEKTSAQRFMPGGRPFGILTTGALQRFVYLHRQLPCRAPVVVGSEIIAYSTILTLRHLGGKPMAIVETGPDLSTSRVVAGGARLIFGVPTFRNARISNIQGDRRVEAVTILYRGAPRVLSCDGIIFTGAWLPEASLVRASHIRVDPLTKGPSIDKNYCTSDPQVFAAGNVLGPARSAGTCVLQGRTAARVIANELQQFYSGTEEEAGVTRV
jgi:thioredoxin reductase